MTAGGGALERRLGLGGAVFLGVGSMLGTGVFVVWSPAAERAGQLLLLALGLAALVAYCNATSTAQLAAIHPESGGAYVYGRLRLGRWWGTLAGWAFVVGKTASCAAAALAIGTYAWPEQATPVAMTVVVVATAINMSGISKTAGVTKALVMVVVAVLALAVATALVVDVETGPSDVDSGGSPVGVLAAAALFFFAFAGYARVATLGAEVRAPARTIPLAIVIALGVVLAVYVVVGLTLLGTIGLVGLTDTATPLSAAVEGVLVVEPVVRSGAAVAAFAVLLPLLAGVGRTVLAMASYGDLPHALGTISVRAGIPHRAQLIVAIAVLLAVLTGRLVGAVLVSAGAVLVYYAVANAAALKLSAEERRWPRGLAMLGLAGCATLAASLLTEGVLV